MTAMDTIRRVQVLEQALARLHAALQFDHYGEPEMVELEASAVHAAEVLADGFQESSIQIPDSAPAPIADTANCPRCDETKPLEDFGINHSKPDGRQVYCRPCARDASRAKRPASKPLPQPARPATTEPRIARAVPPEDLGTDDARPVPMDRERMRREIASLRDSDPARARELTDQLMAGYKADGTTGTTA